MAAFLESRIKNLELRIKVFLNYFLIALFFTVITGALLVLIALFYTPTVHAQTPPPCNPNIPGACPAGLKEIEQVFGNVVSVVAGLGFVAMLVLLVWAGIKYITSGGEPKAIQQAHLTVTWALLGVLFLAIAWLILQLIQAFTGIEVTVFNIRSLCDAGKWC